MAPQAWTPALVSPTPMPANIGGPAGSPVMCIIPE